MLTNLLSLFQRINLKNFILFCFIVIISKTAFADFTIKTKKWPQEITSDDIEIKNDGLIPLKSSNLEKSKKIFDGTWYIKTGINISTLKLDDIQRVTSIIDAANPGIATRNIQFKRVTKDNIRYEIGAGYLLKNKWSMELNYMYNYRVPYNTRTVFFTGGGTNDSISSSVRNNAFTMDFSYNFQNIYFFKPYLSAIVGLSITDIKSKLNPLSASAVFGDTYSNTRYNLAWGFSAGAKIKLRPRLFTYINYKYLDLNKAHWRNSMDTFKLKSDVLYSGLSLGFIYNLK